MCKGLEDWLNDEVNKVRDEDKDKLHKSYLACAKVMVKNHDPANDILDTTDLSMEELEEIAREEGVLLNLDA